MGSHGKECTLIDWPNSQKIVLSGVANCHNLPFGGRATRGSRVHLPWEENARSHHQRLFEENVGKTGKVWSTRVFPLLLRIPQL